MSDILNNYFYKKTNNLQNNSSTKYFKEIKDKIKLINCGLYLSENNILKIPKKLYSINKSNISKSHKNIYLLFHKNSKFLNQRKKKRNICQKYHNKGTFNKNYSVNSKRNDIIKINNDENKKKTMYYNVEIKKNEKSNIYSYLDEKKYKVEEIIKSLMNDIKEKRNKKIIYNYLSRNISEITKPTKSYYKKEKYPQEKITSTKNYIEYNLKTKPYNNNSINSFDTQIKFFKNRDYIIKKF